MDMLCLFCMYLFSMRKEYSNFTISTCIAFRVIYHVNTVLSNTDAARFHFKIKFELFFNQNTRLKIINIPE